VIESIIKFGQYKNLIGIISKPETNDEGLPIIIFLNSGMIPMMGPNRLHVNIARKVSQLGFTSFRFDFACVGDSSMADSSKDFEESAVNDVKEAMNMLENVNQTSRFVLIGICTGGDITMKTALVDNRVIGIVPINGVYFDKEIYQSLLTHKKTTNFLFLSKWSYKTLIAKKDCKKFEDMLLPLQKFLNNKVDLFLIYSDGSYRLNMVMKTIMNKLVELRNQRLINLKIFCHLDSMFTPTWAQEYLIDIICKWLKLRYKNNDR